MPKTKNTQPIEQFYARDRQEWRAWLAEHHAISSGVGLIYYKKGASQPFVSYDEAVEEALCFGWIDSRLKKLDDERYVQLYSPRKPNSPWAKTNKVRVERLIAQGLMTPAGLAKVEAAKQNGQWDIYNQIDDLTIPPDLEEALAANPEAARYFMAFSDSSKKIILWWIESAKRPETRAKRIAEAVSMVAENRKANHYRQ